MFPYQRVLWFLYHGIVILTCFTWDNCKSTIRHLPAKQKQVFSIASVQYSSYECVLSDTAYQCWQGSMNWKEVKEVTSANTVEVSFIYFILCSIFCPFRNRDLSCCCLTTFKPTYTLCDCETCGPILRLCFLQMAG